MDYTTEFNWGIYGAKSCSWYFYFLEFFFAKLEISNVHVLDTFGPSHEVSLKDYFAAKV